MLVSPNSDNTPDPRQLDSSSPDRSALKSLTTSGAFNVTADSQTAANTTPQPETFTRRIVTPAQLALLRRVQEPLNTLLIEWPSSKSENIEQQMLDSLNSLHRTLAHVLGAVLNYRGEINLQQVIDLREQLRQPEVLGIADNNTRLEWVGDRGAKLRQYYVAEQLCSLYVGFNESPVKRMAALERAFLGSAWVLKRDFAKLGIETKAKLVIANLVGLLAVQTGDVEKLGTALENAHSDLRSTRSGSDRSKDNQKVYQAILRVVRSHAQETVWVRRLSEQEARVAGNLANEWCKSISISQRDLSSSLYKVLRSPVSLPIIDSTIGVLECYGAMAMIPIIKSLNERQCVVGKSEYQVTTPQIEQQFYLRLLDALKKIADAEPHMLQRLQNLGSIPVRLAEKALSDFERLNVSGSIEQRTGFMLRLLKAAAALGQEEPKMKTELARIGSSREYSMPIRRAARKLCNQYPFNSQNEGDNAGANLKF